MNLQNVVPLIEQMQRDGIVAACAIGGAVAATFYLESVSTLDIDIFVAFYRKPGELLITLDPIFDYFKARGCEVKGEYLMIGGWPVQFLPAPSPLVDEALEVAQEKEIAGSVVRVFGAEYLAAIALQTGRPKDKLRVLQFTESKLLDLVLFQAILERHRLIPAWQKFTTQFLTENP